MGPHQGSNESYRWSGRCLLVTPGLCGQATPPTLEAVRPHHLLHHPHHQALLEAAELATVPSTLVHGAIFVRQTNILGILLNCPLEESLAALTSSHPIVLAGSIVPAHRAQQAHGSILASCR